MPRVWSFLKFGLLLTLVLIKNRIFFFIYFSHIEFFPGLFEWYLCPCQSTKRPWEKKRLPALWYVLSQPSVYRGHFNNADMWSLELFDKTGEATYEGRKCVTEASRILHTQNNITFSQCTDVRLANDSLVSNKSFKWIGSHHKDLFVCDSVTAARLTVLNVNLDSRTKRATCPDKLLEFRYSECESHRIFENNYRGLNEYSKKSFGIIHAECNWITLCIPPK